MVGCYTRRLATTKVKANLLSWAGNGAREWTPVLAGRGGHRPMIEPVMIEVPNPGHPYGAKGAAEVNICPPMAAIANAIERAVGTRLTELPMSPPKVRAAIDARGQE
jgi:hypothetical protein